MIRGSFDRPATPDPILRHPFWDWALAALLIANLGWTTLCLGGYRAETMVVTCVLTALLVALHGVSVMATPEPWRPHPAGFWPLPFLGYALYNVACVTPVPWLGWHDWFLWAQMAAIFWVALNGFARDSARRTVAVGIVVITVIAVGMQIYQRSVDARWLMLNRRQAMQYLPRASGAFGIPNSMAAWLLLVFFPSLALTTARTVSKRLRLAAGGFAALCVIGLVLTISRGAWLAFAVTMAVWPLTVAGRRWPWRLGVSMLAFALTLGAGVAAYRAVPSIQRRFHSLILERGESTRPIMWRIAWTIFKDSPVHGSGAGSYDTLFERHRPEGFTTQPHWAHNDYLNTLSDYGLIGFSLSFGAVALLAGTCGWKASRQRKSTVEAGWPVTEGTRGIGLGLLAFALALLVDFHLKLPALGIIVAAGTAEWVRRCWHRPDPTTSSQHWRVILPLGGAIWLAFTVMGIRPKYEAEAIRYATHQKLNQLAKTQKDPDEEIDHLVYYERALLDALMIDPSNAQIWADYAYTLTQGNSLNGATSAEAAANRALALSEAVPDFWIRRGVALDTQGRWKEAGRDYLMALKLAPNNAVSWYYQAYHLGLKEGTVELAEAAIKISLRLDPSNQAADTLRVRLADRQVR